MFAPERVSRTLRSGLRQPLRRLLRSSPTAAAFAQDPAGIPAPVLLRHVAEHVFRIRMFRALDAEATRRIETEAPEVAAQWARYARSEAVHDRYFLRDLDAVGIGRDAVEALQPFPATRELGAWAAGAMAVYGALPVVLYSFWAEQNSDTGSAAVIERTRAGFGPLAVRGAAAHRALDDGQDHPALIDAVLAGLIRDEAGLLLAIDLLEAISELIGRYFSELDAWGRTGGDALFVAAAACEHRARTTETTVEARAAH
jgi:hypothetical protein